MNKLQDNNIIKENNSEDSNKSNNTNTILNSSPTSNNDEKANLNDSNLPIEKSFDIEQSLKSITQRYYTPYYSLDVGNNKNEDQCVLFHSNKIALITLASSHPLLKETKKIKQIDFQINSNINRIENKVSGKGKRGAQLLQKHSILCHIECEDGSKYSPRSCINGKLVEVNEQLIENPNLLISSPQEEGYIGLVLPNLHKVEEIKEELMKEEEYNKRRNIIE